MAYDRNELQELRNRLRAGKLDENDISRLEELISAAEELARLQEAAPDVGGGRKLIAKLPFGFDIVK